LNMAVYAASFEAELGRDKVWLAWHAGRTLRKGMSGDGVTEGTLYPGSDEEVALAAGYADPADSWIEPAVYLSALPASALQADSTVSRIYLAQGTANTYQFEPTIIEAYDGGDPNATHRVIMNDFAHLFIQFDLPDVLLAQGVTSATLTFYQNPGVGEEAATVFEIAKITQSWDYSTTNWNNRPSVDVGSAFQFTTAAGSTLRKTTVNLLSFANDWFTTPGQGFGVRIRGISGSTAEFWMVSPETQARLDVQYYPFNMKLARYSTALSAIELPRNPDSVYSTSESFPANTRQDVMAPRWEALFPGGNFDNATNYNATTETFINQFIDLIHNGGAGGGGSSGEPAPVLGYNIAPVTIPVTPGETLTVVVGPGGTGGVGGTNTSAIEPTGNQYKGTDGTSGSSSRVNRGSTTLVSRPGGRGGLGGHNGYPGKVVAGLGSTYQSQGGNGASALYYSNPGSGGRNGPVWVYNAITLYPTQDRALDQFLVHSYTATELRIDQDTHAMAFLQFDVSNLVDSTPTATLRLYATFYLRDLEHIQLSVRNITASWIDSTVTYATALATLGSQVAGFTATAADQYYDINITSLVQGWIENPATNFGVAIYSSQNLNESSSVRFGSVENATVAFRPQLIMTPTDPAEESVGGTFSEASYPFDTETIPEAWFEDHTRTSGEDGISRNNTTSVGLWGGVGGAGRPGFIDEGLGAPGAGGRGGHPNYSGFRGKDGTAGLVSIVPVIEP